MTTRIIIATIKIYVESGEPSEDCVPEPMVEATREALETAIHERLFGEGFTPDSVVLDDWTVRVAVID